ncbi:ABC transporter substrate-binding protein [Paenibacillus roseipurpureus]|uniref:Sugar ABC transporter substrate-binding protein n=1 Tax=Paenibacillus roseopurpureus TaxID=2918901 RepID=A0AA96LLP3_9BACL|nr:sugar ABC transporter substrate-binding protein [Paenibacillus sp. MBLB1832]WNR44055.1 sugar ABC transporter substrate-binding protein [Paenibacillus sp. MBLB1832]
MRKHITLLATLSISLASLLSACGSTDSKASPSPSAVPTTSQKAAEPAKPMTLKLSLWGDDTRKKLYEEYGKKFTALHPNINVEIMLIPSAEYQQKMSILLASKQGPDVAWFTERAYPQFLGADQLLDLSEIKNDANYNFNDMLPGTFDLLKKGDKVYGVPFAIGPKVLFFNKTLFKEKGLKTPLELSQEGKWDYPTMVSTAKALTDSSKGIYGLNLFESGGWKAWVDALVETFWGFGAELFNQEGTKFLLNSPQGEQVMQMYYDMLYKDQSHLKPGDQTTFDTGKVAMVREVYSYSAKARNIKDFEWDIAPMPTPPIKDAPAAVGMAGYSVIKSTEHPKEALELLKYFTSADVEKELTQFYLPNRKSVLESDAILGVGKPSKEAIKTALISPFSKTLRFQPSHPNWQQIDVKMQTLFDFLYSKTATPKQVLEKMEQDITPLLK